MLEKILTTGPKRLAMLETIMFTAALVDGRQDTFQTQRVVRAGVLSLHVLISNKDATSWVVEVSPPSRKEALQEVHTIVLGNEGNRLFVSPWWLGVG